MMKVQELGNQMLTLAKPSIQDLVLMKRIHEGIDFELDTKLLVDLLVGFCPREIRVVRPPWIVRLRIWL